QKAVEEQMKVELVRKEREIDLKEKEILVSQKQYDADVKKKADADKYAVEQAAEAEKVKQMRLAEASQYTTESQAKGAAEAEVIRLRGLAEAEARERQAEAFEKFGQAAVLDIVAKMLPELAGKVAAPLASIDKLTVVDSGNGSGALQFSQYVTQLMATVPEMLKNVSGIDVTQLVRGLTEKQDGAPAKPENAEDKDKKEV
ncbi:flotillin family protein, partial [Salmonella enterica]|nr:flotillin family protein [Salmonella enterica]